MVTIKLCNREAASFIVLFIFLSKGVKVSFITDRLGGEREGEGEREGRRKKGNGS